MPNIAEGKKTTFDKTLVDRIAGGLATIAQSSARFFTPVPAPRAIAQESEGRRFDYSQGYNLQSTPRREEKESSTGYDFGTLRSFADNYDLLRLVIETRKDQLCKMNWNIVARDSKGKVEDDDPDVMAIRNFFMFPDTRLDWNSWLRIVVEDMLVIDAATVYPRMNKGGTLHSLEIMDGATIKLLIDNDGRTPVAPEPAYQQQIKGVPMAEYTTDELIYRPRNMRSWKLYGFSPVEQVMMTVNIALRRQLSQLHYFTEGNIPEAWATCPPEWTPDNIREIQAIWDTEIEGKPQLKRKVKFMPGGVGIEQTRESTIKDQYDEWLARLICFAFSISPQALIQMMNRATAETASEQAMSEGLAPLMQWVKSFMDYIIVKHFGNSDLEFMWDNGEELDPKTQAEIHKIYVDAGVLDADEVRLDIGRDSRAGKTATAPSVSPGELSPPGDQSALPAVSGDGQAVAAADGVVAPDSSAESGALSQLDAAIALHEQHMNGTAPTTGPAGEKSQQKMMDQMMAARDALAPQKIDASGNSMPAMQSASASAVPGTAEAKVADAAMNGTQISSLMEALTLVADKKLPAATVQAMMTAAFPAIKAELIQSMLDGLVNFEPVQPPAPVLPGVPGAVPKAGAVVGEEEAGDEAKPAKPKLAAKTVPAAMEKSVASDLGNSIYEALQQVRDSVSAQLDRVRPESLDLEKAKAGGRISRILRAFEMDAFDNLSETVSTVLGKVTTRAATTAARSLSKHVADPVDTLKLANTRAEAWASQRAGELIGSNAAGGELADATRELIRNDIIRAEQEGWTNAELRSALEDNYAFSKSRASTIAKTELKSAGSNGNLEGWKASGLKMKKSWALGATDACEVCEGNASEGDIPLDDSFSSGDETAPAHPNCDCAVLPVIDPEEM